MCCHGQLHGQSEQYQVSDGMNKKLSGNEKIQQSEVPYSQKISRAPIFDYVF